MSSFCKEEEVVVATLTPAEGLSAVGEWDQFCGPGTLNEGWTLDNVNLQYHNISYLENISMEFHSGSDSTSPRSWTQCQHIFSLQLLNVTENCQIRASKTSSMEERISPAVEPALKWTLTWQWRVKIRYERTVAVIHNFQTTNYFMKASLCGYNGRHQPCGDQPGGETF